MIDPDPDLDPGPHYDLEPHPKPEPHSDPKPYLNQPYWLKIPTGSVDPRYDYTEVYQPTLVFLSKADLVKYTNQLYSIFIQGWPSLTHFSITLYSFHSYYRRYHWSWSWSDI